MSEFYVFNNKDEQRRLQSVFENLKDALGGGMAFDLIVRFHGVDGDGEDDHQDILMTARLLTLVEPPTFSSVKINFKPGIER